ncbi:unnamed protein product [Mytilus edulis]|uniref:Exonuclease domain-containing protein n=1 Tax=Mytilus edulis TaxID=6550 RepID=A0A8S3UB66_MYTED|nr:unnamed protein product [Mytilus edulis]
MWHRLSLENTNISTEEDAKQISAFVYGRASLDKIPCDFQQNKNGEYQEEYAASCSTQMSNADSQGSLWLQNSQDTDTSDHMDYSDIPHHDMSVKHKALDNFLQSCGLSHVKKQLKINWNLSSERTQYDYSMKTKQIFEQVVNVLAPGQGPGQGSHLLDSVMNSNPSTSSDKMLEILSTVYDLSSDWGTQRQILSVFANNFTFKEMSTYIPNLTKYRYTAARKHASEKGQGQPVLYKQIMTVMQFMPLLVGQKLQQPVVEYLQPDNTNSVCDPINVTGITASADGAYQRRGSGRCYNSLSGTASMIGKKTGKVVGYSARYKRCRKCDVAKLKKRLPTKHKCRKNWCGSAKSMEPDMIVEILKDAKKKDTPVITLIGDDDCTAFNRARCEVDSCLEKVSDINHVKKNISNRLHKIKGKYKELSVKTITALLKSFSFMLAQNKGDSDRIKNSLPSVVLHQFGNHDGCGDWCQMKNKPTAKHRNLPWGADLKDENLKKDLLKVFTDLDPGKMSKLDSSNPNESFNNTVRSKAPKDKHYTDAQEPDLTVIPGPSEDNCEHIEKVVVFYDLETTGLSRQSSIHTNFCSFSHQVTFQGVQPNKESLEHLLRNKVLSRTIFKKLEDLTLTYNHLKISYHRDGFDGLFYLLSEKTCSGKARISNNRRVIQKIADFLSNEE